MALPSPSIAQSGERSQYFERAAKALDRRNDATGAAWIRELGLGERIVPRTLSEGASAAHPQYAERYDRSRVKIRDGILHRRYRAEEMWRVDRAEAALHLVGYELEQGISANEADVRAFLSDAEWMLSGFFHEDPVVRPNRQPEPDAQIWVVPERIMHGETAILSWTTSGAGRVILNGQMLDTEGRMDIHPESSTYYGLTATGPGGTMEASAVIEVIRPRPAPSPRVTLHALPDKILQGRATKLRWTSRHAKTLRLDGKIVPPTGSMFVTPETSQRYEIIAEGPGGIAVATSRVEVVAPVKVARASGPETKSAPGSPAAPVAPRVSPAPAAKSALTRAETVAAAPQPAPFIYACDSTGRPADSAAWAAAFAVAQRLRNEPRLRMRIAVTAGDTTTRAARARLKAAATGARNFLAATFQLKKTRFQIASTPAPIPASSQGIQILLIPIGAR